MKHPEQSLQQAVAQLLDAVLLPPATWTAVGHGGGGKVRGAILKGMGVRAGWPDVQILCGKLYCIELKSKYRKPSPSQVLCHEEIRLAGGEVAVCRSLEDVVCELSNWRLPMRPVTVRVGGVPMLPAHLTPAFRPA